MNASSGAGLCATWMIIRGWSAARDAPGFLERGDDVRLMGDVLGARGRALGRLGGHETLIEAALVCITVLHLRRASSEDQAEQVPGILLEQGICLGAGDDRVVRRP